MPGTRGVRIVWALTQRFSESLVVRKDFAKTWPSFPVYFAYEAEGAPCTQCTRRSCFGIQKNARVARRVRLHPSPVCFVHPGDTSGTMQVVCGAGGRRSASFNQPQGPIIRPARGHFCVCGAGSTNVNRCEIKLRPSGISYESRRGGDTNLDSSVFVWACFFPTTTPTLRSKCPRHPNETPEGHFAVRRRDIVFSGSGAYCRRNSQERNP